VQLTDGGEQLSHWLAGKPKVANIQVSERVVRFQFACTDPQLQAELLRAIISANFSVLEYSTESRSLEDVFLQITTGAVQ
jgi:hypothetical protein